MRPQLVNFSKTILNTYKQRNTTQLVYSNSFQMCTISKSSNLPEGSKKDLQPQNIKRSKLSPTSRLFDMLSHEQNMKSELSDSSHETGPLVYTETEPCADTKSHIDNPTNYDSSNPRSNKNMSYLQTADAKESNGSSLQSGMLRCFCVII